MEKTNRKTWPRTVSKDIQPFNIGIHSAWRPAADRQQWHELVDTAMLQQEYQYAIKEGGQTDLKVFFKTKLI